MIADALAILETDEQRNVLSEFYEENKKRLLAFAYSKLHKREDAEDVIQDVFVNIMKYPEKFFAMEVHKRLPYTLIIIRNEISHRFNNQNRIDTDELDEDISDGSLSVENMVIGKISAENMKKFIREMPRAQREAIELKTIYGLTNSEIAGVLKISEATARKRISNACKLIKEYVNGASNNE